MRTFYAFWFFFCSGWGYILASFAESDAPTWGNLVASFPVALLFSVVMIWLELRTLPAGRLADQPSLKLKPWNRPTGLILFVGLTFVFASLWGVAIALAANMSGLRASLNALSLGAGAVGALIVCRHAFPAKFGV